MECTKLRLLLLWTVFFASGSCQDNLTQVDFVQDPEAVDRSIVYYITAPKVIKPFSQYPISVTIKKGSSPVNITLSIQQNYWSRYDYNRASIGTNNGTLTVSGQVPPDTTVRFNIDVKALDTGYFVLQAKGQDQQGHNFTEEASLTVRRTNNLIFIQTDKPLYKLGDTVKFRVLVIDLALRPVRIPLDIKVYDPQRNLIHQNLQINSANATTQAGFFGSELQLASEAPLGSWSIEITSKTEETTIKRFSVEEYVLPRFDVQLKAPEYIISLQDSFEVTLNASYTFGQPVKGKAFIQVQGPSKWDHLRHRTTYPSKTYNISDFDGFTKIKVYVADVTSGAQDFTSDWSSIRITANVTEATTNTDRPANTKSVNMKSYPYKLNIIKTVSTFKPGFPYTITVAATQHDGRPIPPTTRKLVVTGSQSSSLWGSGYFDEERREFTVPANGSVDVTVIPSKETRTLFFRARLGKVRDSLTVSGFESPSNSFMQIYPQFKNVSVTNTATFTINLTNPFPQLNYTVISKGQIVTEGQIAADGPAATLSLPLDRNYTPRSRLLVYYMLPDTEVVANVVDFEVSGLIQNNITITVRPENRTDYAEPGERASIKIETAPKSFVGLLAMDQSLLLLKKGNDLYESDITGSFGAFDSDSWAFENAFGSSGFKFPNGGSVFQFLQQAGLLVLSNAAIPGNPKDADNDRYYSSHRQTGGSRYASSARSGSSSRSSAGSSYASSSASASRRPVVSTEMNLAPEKSKSWTRSENAEPRIRQDFRETFLYETFNSENGSIEITRDIPDTITSWVCSAFSMNNEVGLGITKEPPMLKVFRPFFAVLNLPFSIIRGETVQLEVLVFNYLGQDQNAQVTLEIGGQDANGNKFTASPRTKQVSVKSQNSASVIFPVKAEVAGEISIKATAIADMAGDALVRKLKVKPEGVRQQFNAPLFIDLRNETSFSADVLIPLPNASRVEGSEKLVFTAIGDLLGPTIYGIDNLIRLPYGCGEQNMALFAPNVFVMKYLKNADRLEERTRENLLRNMRSGYQRQLTFKHYDNSYSAFGDSDASGSTFLTAFVARTFFQAKEYITIDDSVISGALSWLLRQQAENGSFPEVGKVFDRQLQGGAGKGTALTAYVLITLIEAQSMGNYSANILNATRFLEAQSKDIASDPYALSIVNFALQLAGSNGLEFTSSRLAALAVVANGTKHWAKEREIEIQGYGKYHWEYKLPAKDVEMTAYALLSAIRKKDVEGGFPILAWLLSNRNDQGGFQTSQDTVVGLQAISEFAQLAQSKDRDITVHVTADDHKNDFSIKDENALVLQTSEPKRFHNHVFVEASGKGTALVQVSWIYYVRNTSNEKGFAVTTKVTKGVTELLLKFCTNYQGQNESNMAVMEATLPSGYQVDEEEIKKLKGVVQDLSRVDVEDDDSRLVLYFDKLTKEERCIVFTGYRKFTVDNLQDSNVVVYNYYDPIEKQTAFYNPKDAQ